MLIRLNSIESHPKRVFCYCCCGCCCGLVVFVVDVIVSPRNITLKFDPNCRDVVFVYVVVDVFVLSLFLLFMLLLVWFLFLVSLFFVSNLMVDLVEFGL